MTEEVFGAMPDRPTHPDFWKLSELILKMDAEMQEARTTAQKDAIYERYIGEVAEIDMRSLTYAAMQRAFRAYEVRTRGDLQRSTNRANVMRFTTAYMEGFILGSQWQQSYAPKEHPAD
jgi:hypothetical protein